jgi:TRAP-type mannitol/chloroaromatic compound transport system permease small subunit
METSRETSGLPWVYLLKALIPAFAVLMALQGVAQAIRAAHALRTPPVTPGLESGVHRPLQDGLPDRARQ